MTHDRGEAAGQGSMAKAPPLAAGIQPAGTDALTKMAHTSKPKVSRCRMWAMSARLVPVLVKCHSKPRLREHRFEH
jgi:hypothetical protein